MDLKRAQFEFAQALRRADLVPASDGGADYAERFDTYRNNAWQFFATALEQTYPVVQRRVGPDFFRQLAREYRTEHPSRHGDLHWVGADFPAWLEHRMAGSGYEWLADLARLEWAVAEASTAATAPAAEVVMLAAIAPEALADVRVTMHPSVRFVDSGHPIWSIWQANQQPDASPVDMKLGSQHCMIACIDQQPVVFRIDASDHLLLERLAAGDTLAGAMEFAHADAEALGRVLGWAFGEGLVAGVVSPSAPA